MLSSKVHIEGCSIVYLSPLEYDITVYFQKQNNFSKIGMFLVEKDGIGNVVMHR